MRNMKISTGLLAALSIIALSACEEQKYDVDYPEYVLESGYEELELAWSEEFDYDGLPDDAVWGYEEGYAGDGELQDYKKSDVNYSSAGDGILTIRTARDTHQGPSADFEFSSACLTTSGKHIFGPGRLDIMAKIPVGRGVAPFFALLPADAGDKTTEIRLMSYVYGDADARNRIYSTVSADHLPDGYNVNGGYANCSTIESAAHLYSVVMSEESVEFLFDNRSIYTLTKEDYGYEPWPFVQDFYLKLGVAVGGAEAGAWGIDTTIFPKEMSVDYIRYYKVKEAE